jgi:hypothetical protein
VMKCGRIVEVVYNVMPWNPIRHKYMQAFVVCIIFVYMFIQRQMNTVLVGTGRNSKFLNKVFYDLYTKLKAILATAAKRIPYTLLQLRIGVAFFENFYFDPQTFILCNLALWSIN